MKFSFLFQSDHNYIQSAVIKKEKERKKTEGGNKKKIILRKVYLTRTEPKYEGFFKEFVVNISQIMYVGIRNDEESFIIAFSDKSYIRGYFENNEELKSLLEI